MDALFRDPRPASVGASARPRAAFDATGSGQSSTRARVGLANSQLARRAGQVERGLVASSRAAGAAGAAGAARAQAVTAAAGLSRTMSASARRREEAPRRRITRPPRTVSEGLFVGGDRGNRPSVQVEIRNRCGADARQYRPTASRKVPVPTPTQFTDYLPSQHQHRIPSGNLRAQSRAVAAAVAGEAGVHQHIDRVSFERGDRNSS